MGTEYHFVVFGASGSIGAAICAMGVAKGWRVTGVSRSLPGHPVQGVQYIELDPVHQDLDAVMPFANMPAFHAVCWAQGMNLADDIKTVDVEQHLEIYAANCLYIVKTLQHLLRSQALQAASRLCVISSIWQNLARQNKLSYCMTKAALEGLVLSTSADLAAEGHLINAVLPGVVDTPMTRANLQSEQIARIAGGTSFDRLVALQDVTSVVGYLCSSDNTGITGQFLAADLGWSRVRIV